MEGKVKKKGSISYAKSEKYATDSLCDLWRYFVHIDVNVGVHVNLHCSV